MTSIMANDATIGQVQDLLLYQSFSAEIREASGRELLQRYERIHAYFMADKRFWYEPGRIAADAIFCILASDLRLSLRGPRDAAH